MRGAAPHPGAGELDYKQPVKRWLRIRYNGWTRALLALAMIAMIMRAVTPSGYMFEAGDHGRFLTVTLCSAHGAGEAVLDLKTGALIDQKSKPAEGKKQAPDSPCGYALANVFAAPQASGVVLAPFAIAMQAPSPIAALRPGLGLVAPPPPARGPPSLIV